MIKVGDKVEVVNLDKASVNYKIRGGYCPYGVIKEGAIGIVISKHYGNDVMSVQFNRGDIINSGKTHDLGGRLNTLTGYNTDIYYLRLVCNISVLL